MINVELANGAVIQVPPAPWSPAYADMLEAWGDYAADSSVKRMIYVVDSICGLAREVFGDEWNEISKHVTIEGEGAVVWNLGLALRNMKIPEPAANESV